MKKINIPQPNLVYILNNNINGNNKTFGYKRKKVKEINCCNNSGKLILSAKREKYCIDGGEEEEEELESDDESFQFKMSEDEDMSFDKENNISNISNNNNMSNHNDDNEEKEEGGGVGDEDDDLALSFCKGLNSKPLAVPMVADTNQNSVTRNDAKIITESRLKRLKELSQRPEDELSKDQKCEKKRIIRLEKNRRAAAMSRRKKKMYVKNLEERNALMTKHLALLEMENAHLRAILNVTGHQPHTTHHHHNNNNTNTNSSNNTIEISIEPSHKKRRLNNGTAISSRSPSCSTESSKLEPLPLPLPLPSNIQNIQNIHNNNNNNVCPPPLPPQFIHIPNIALPPHIIAQNIPHLIHIPHHHNNNNNIHSSSSSLPELSDLLPKIGKVDLATTNSNINNIINKNENETKDESVGDIDDINNALPPEIIVSLNDDDDDNDNNDFLSIMDDDYVFESVQECGDIIQCENTNVYV